MRNKKTNHTGLGGWNLGYNNYHVMNKYYRKHKVDYPVQWFNRYRKTVFWFLFGWRPWEMTTEKRHAKMLTQRWNSR